MGVNTGGANGVYWIRILDKQAAGTLLIENLYDAGKRKLGKMTSLVESDHVYKLIRSGDLEKWLPKPTSKNLLLLLEFQENTT